MSATVEIDGISIAFRKANIDASEGLTTSILCGIECRTNQMATCFASEVALMAKSGDSQIFVVADNPFSDVESLPNHLKSDTRLLVSGITVLVAIAPSKLETLLDIWDAETHIILVGNEMGAIASRERMVAQDKRWLLKWSDIKPNRDELLQPGILAAVVRSSTHRQIEMVTRDLTLGRQVVNKAFDASLTARQPT